MLFSKMFISEKYLYWQSSSFRRIAYQKEDRFVLNQTVEHYDVLSEM